MIEENESMNDPKNDPRLTAYVMGELSADDVRKFEQSLAESPELAVVVDEIRSTIGALESAFATEQPLELSTEQKLAIESAAQSDGGENYENSLNVERAAKDRSETSSRPWGRWLLAAAIGTVLIGGGVFLANPNNQDVRQAIQNETISQDKLPVAETAAIKEQADAVSAAAPMELELDAAQGQRLLKEAGEELAEAKQEPMREKHLMRSDLAQAREASGAPVEGLDRLSRSSSMQMSDSLEVVDEDQIDSRFELSENNASESLAMNQKMERANQKFGFGGAGGGGMGGGTPDHSLDDSQMTMGDAFGETPVGEMQPHALPQRLAGRLTDAKTGQALGVESRQRPDRFEFGLRAEASKRGHYDSDQDSLRTWTPIDHAKTTDRERPVDFKGNGTDQYSVTNPEIIANLKKFDAEYSRRHADGGGGEVQDTEAAVDRIMARARKAGEKAIAKAEKLEAELDEDRELESAKPKLVDKKKNVKAIKTWKRVKAIPNTTRLMVGDKEELDLTGMQVNVQVDGFRARVLIDYLYYNDRDRQLEGNFKLRLPEDSSLYYFAFGESANELTPQRQLARREFANNGAQFVSFTPAAITKSRGDVWRNVKEARMVPREQAAYAFRETVRRRVDPALVEWSGAGVFNAKVFPLAPKKVHRIVIGYDVNLTRSGNQLTYQLDLPESTGDCRIEINAQDVEGIKYDIEPKVEPVEVDHNDELHQRFTFDQRPENGIRLTAKTEEALLLKSKELADEFWAAQITPELPVQEAVGSGRAIFMLDMSLSSAPDKFNVWLKLLETTLANNRETMKEFGVLMFSVDQRFWNPQYVANTADNVAELKNTLGNLVLEGATDLYAAMQKVTTTDWVIDGEAPDLFLLSDGAANWGETNGRLIGSLLAGKETGSLFAYQTGLTGTAIANLRLLAGQTGGAVFSVASEDEIATASTAHRKRPWKLSSITAEGATDVMTAGRVEWVYPGQTLTVVGRGVVSGPMKLEFEQAGKSMSVTSEPTAIVSELAGRLYGQVSVGQLESLGSAVFDISAAYARHFRITGDTCSLLMLESKADYERFDIKPQEDEFVIKSKPASKLVADMLKKAANQLADPKAQLLAWLKRLETMQGLKFAMPTALKLAIDDIDVVVVSQPLDCTVKSRDDVSKGYLNALTQESLDYDVIAGQAKKRGRESIDDSIKVFSSLIERNPGDVTMARDVAFTAMELDRPAQAYHLLRSVARARPFQGSIYPAIGQCLAQAGQADMAIVYYEVALAGEFQRQGSKFRQIVAVDYMHLLRRIVSGKTKSSVVAFAKARLETLKKKMPISKADMLVTIMWNQDQTDVDLHVIEPSGEKCFYSHKKTKSGGEITDDITTGFGPEMYFNETAPDGTYKIAVKFYGSGQNRTSVKNKVYLSVFEGFGSDEEKVTRKTIRLKDAGEHRTVMEVVK